MGVSAGGGLGNCALAEYDTTPLKSNAATISQGRLRLK